MSKHRCAKVGKRPAGGRGGSSRSAPVRSPLAGAPLAVADPSSPATTTEEGAPELEAGGPGPPAGVEIEPESPSAGLGPVEGSPEPPEGGTGPLEGGSESAEGGTESTEGPPAGPESSGSAGSAQSEPATPFRFFAPTSFWNRPLSANAPLDPSSSATVSAFDGEIAQEEEARHGPWINTTSYSVPIYTVPANQPTVNVALEPSLTAPALQSAWSAVPLPSNARPAAGTDSALVVWQPSTDRLWEFWRLSQTGAGWEASWGGAMQQVSSNAGVYGPEAWPGAKAWWGSSASSLSIVGGLITLEDLERGQINHALSMAIPKVRAGVYSAPAQRDDGKSAEPISLPEGAHLRLDPKLNLAALQLPRLTLMIAEAAQRYGIFVRDRGGNVCLFAQDPRPTGTEPYTGSGGYFEGKYPSQLLAAFPWSHLQLLELQLHKNP
jgi:hypothetical protein